MKSRSSCLSLLQAAVALVSFSSRSTTTTFTDAFSVPPVSTATTRWGHHPAQSSSTALGPVVVGSKDASNALSYSEQSRRYRRDFFTHDSWLRHRSKDRFVGTLIKILDSGVVRALAEELIVVGGVATFVIVYNALCVVGYDDLMLQHHDALAAPGSYPLMWLPLAGFTLSSPALSLLLGECVYVRARAREREFGA
eukprot:scaffold4855_cov195-Amphora_coffeaeformis.AAC.23